MRWNIIFKYKVLFSLRYHYHQHYHHYNYYYYYYYHYKPYHFATLLCGGRKILPGIGSRNI